MKGRTPKALLSIIAVLTLLVTSIVPVAAASSPTTSTGSGLRVSPLVTNLTINAGQSQIVPIYIQNVTSAAATFQVDINDFTAGNNENGQPALLLNGQKAPSHSLKQFIAPISDVTLQPGQQQTVDADITIPKGTSGGGYYGAIRFAPTSINGGGKNVTLAASVASLILVTVPGNYKQDLQLSSFAVSKTNSQGVVQASQVLFTNSNNLVAVARFDNSGDAQEQPFGKILLTSNGKTLATYTINDTVPPGNVLPDSIRMFTVPLTKIGSFGKYTVEGNFGYGTNGQLLSGTTTFYIVPIPLIAAVIIIILLILFLIFGLPRMIRSYNRRVIRKASRR